MNTYKNSDTIQLQASRIYMRADCGLKKIQAILLAI